jgi:hypothetical protein
MIYEELSDEVKALIDKEADERFKFKMNEFLTSIKNIYPFWLRSSDPYVNMVGQNIAEHYNILTERFKKEMSMGLPSENLIISKRNVLLNEFEQEFKETYVDKFRGRIDSVLLFKLEKFILKYIDKAFDCDKK